MKTLNAIQIEFKCGQTLEVTGLFVIELGYIFKRDLYYLGLYKLVQRIGGRFTLLYAKYAEVSGKKFGCHCRYKAAIV